MEINWENLDSNLSGYLWRSKVPGGWLLKEVQDLPERVLELQGGMSRLAGDSSYWTSCITFVPDPEHVWGT